MDDSESSAVAGHKLRYALHLLISKTVMLKKIPLLILFVSCSSLYGIAIDGFSSLTNDRFANDVTFEGNAYDFSGVGRTSNSRWATLVSRNVILSANHFQPSQSGTVTFYETNDPMGNSVTINVQSGSGQRIGASDLWIAVLEEAVPANYATYSFATENITSSAELASSPYALNNAFLLGRSPSDFDSLTDVAIGRNRLDGWLDDVTAAGTTDDGLLAVDNTAGGVEFESILEVGDSGAPSLLILAMGS